MDIRLKFNLKVKNRLEPEEIEDDEILLVGEDEDDEEENKEY